MRILILKHEGEEVMKKLWFLRVLKINLFVFTALFFLTNGFMVQNTFAQYPDQGPWN